MPWLVRVILGADFEPATDAARILLLAACLRLVLGWTKTFPVSIGRPGLRIVAHGVEIAVLIPLLLVLGARRDATAPQSRCSSPPSPSRSPGRCSSPGCVASRYRRVSERARPLRVLVVSGIWPPDVGGPGSHAPDVAAFLQRRGHRVEVVVTADVQPAPAPLPGAVHVAAAPRRRPACARPAADRLALPACGRRLHDRHVRAQRPRRDAHTNADGRQAHRRPRLERLRSRARSQATSRSSRAAAVSLRGPSSGCATSCSGGRPTCTRRAPTCVSS